MQKESSARYEAWLPKSVLALRQYTVHKLVGDLIAGVAVGLVALPLAMAFAISSGLPPQAGLYTAVVAGFLISALGGSLIWKLPSTEHAKSMPIHCHSRKLWQSQPAAKMANPFTSLRRT